MRLFLFSFLLFFCISSKAQFFQQQASLDHFYSYPFNASFLQSKKVKRVSITHAVKEDGQRIQSKNKEKIIEFNGNGLPQKETEIIGKDSIEIYYYYRKDTLSIIRKFALPGINTIYLNYDSLGKKTIEVRCKEYPSNMDESNYSKAFFKLGRQDVTWIEHYSYEQLSKNQIRKKTYNDQNIVYKEGIIYRDADGNTIEESARYTATGVGESTKFSYGEKQRITEKYFYTDVAGVLEEKTIFTYNEKGNVTNEKFFRNGTLQFELIYFFDKEEIFPEAILTKYPNRTTIDMQTIHVEF